MHDRSSAYHPVRGLDGLRIIGLIKLGKALLLLATTYGLIRLAKPDLVDQLYDWLNSLTDSFERRLLERALDWVDSLGAEAAGIQVLEQRTLSRSPSPLDGGTK